MLYYLLRYFSRSIRKKAWKSEESTKYCRNRSKIGPDRAVFNQMSNDRSTFWFDLIYSMLSIWCFWFDVIDSMLLTTKFCSFLFWGFFPLYILLTLLPFFKWFQNHPTYPIYRTLLLYHNTLIRGCLIMLGILTSEQLLCRPFHGKKHLLLIFASFQNGMNKEEQI